MKNFLKNLLIFISTLFLVSCNNKNSENKLVIGVSPVPHKEIVEFIKEDLKSQGIDLEIVEFNDYVQPNLALKEKSLDANFFQHVPYMESFGKENNIDLVSAGSVHLEPLKIYSDKLKDINELPEGAKVLIPNDPTNRGRALLLLENAGLITLKDNKKLDSNIDDISENKKNIEITALNAEQIGPRLSEVDIAIINTNIALASQIEKEKAIYIEGKDSPYANVIAVLKGQENSEKIKKLMNALQSEKVKNYINEKYKGEIVPAF